jgi:O-antigen/teichoic acid export membrane protein
MLTLGTSSLFASLIFFFGESILRILYGTQYQAGARVLEILSVSIVFSGLWSAMSTTNIALKEPSFSVMTSIIGLIVGTSMFALFVPTAGAAGAAWSINTAYSTGCVIGLALLWKKWHSSKTLLGMPRVP